MVTKSDEREGGECMSVAENLKKARGDIPKKAVAKACGVSLSAMGMYESGARVPRDETKIKLAEYYGVSVQELFFDKK